MMHRYILGVSKSPDKIQSNVVDHINRNKLDNRKSNLRITNNSRNQKNKSIQSNNTSGILGIRFMNTNTGSGWSATVSNNKKRTNKFFSSSKYGYDKAKEMA